MDTVQPCSPFVAALFAGDRIAKPGNAMYHTSIPGSTAKANPLDLAPKLFAYALLTLRDEGALTFEECSKKVLFVTTTWLQVHPTGKPAAWQGLTAQLLQGAAGGKSVKDVVRAWYPGDAYNPWGDAIGGATREAIDAGYLVAAQQGLAGKLGSKITRAVPTTVAPGKEDELHRIAADAAQRWSAFTAREAQLVEELVKQCGGGVSSRRDQSVAAGAGEI